MRVAQLLDKNLEPAAFECDGAGNRGAFVRCACSDEARCRGRYFARNGREAKLIGHHRDLVTSHALESLFDP